MNNKTIYIVVIIFLIILGWREYSHYEASRMAEYSYNSIIDFNTEENSQLKKSIDLKAAESVIMNQKIVSSEIALTQLKEEINGYKRLNSYLKTEVTTTIKNLEARYDNLSEDQFDGIEVKDGSYIHMDEVNKNFLRIPSSFSKKNEWMSIYGTVNKKNTTIDSLLVFNKFDAIIGYRKSGKKFSFLRKNEPIVELKSYNPYTSINYVNNVVVSSNKSKAESIFTSKLAMVFYGVIGGRLIN